MSSHLISVADFGKLIEQKIPLNVLDVRTRGEFEKLHAACAQLMPLDQLDAKAVSEKYRGQTVYVICQAGARAGKACETLAAAGLDQVYSVEGGTIAYEKAGLPVVRGSGGVMSLERQVRIAAGALVAIGTGLGQFVHPLFFIIPAFVGCGLVFAGITDYCGMGMLIAKLPWNE